MILMSTMPECAHICQRGDMHDGDPLTMEEMIRAMMYPAVGRQVDMSHLLAIPTHPGSSFYRWTTPHGGSPNTAEQFQGFNFGAMNSKGVPARSCCQIQILVAEYNGSTRWDTKK